MERVKRYMDLGLRWIRCGWRLFLRNPWQLGGMGVCGTAAAVAVIQIPLIGGPLLGLLAPAAAAAFYIAIEEISKQKIKLPRALRFFAIRQSPREFLNVARDERHLMQVLLIGLCGMIVFVLTDILTWFIAGTALASPLGSLSITTLIVVAIAMIVRIAIYLLLTASLVFTLPLALIQHEALAPAVIASMRRAWEYAIALMVIVGLWLAPLLLGALISFYATWLGYVVGMLMATFIVPISLCSFYCGYRTMFTASQSTQRIGEDFKRANYV